jgi:UPF0755 protein
MSFSKQYFSLLAACLVTLFLFGGWHVLFSPPDNFPSGITIRIASGTSAPDITKEFAEAHIIAHPSLLRFILRITGTDSRVQAGAYRFAVPENVFTVAYRIVAGAYGLPLVRMTFVEGTTVREMSTRVANAFPLISADNFLAAGQPYEGYLFPDTYFFSSSVDADAIVATMRANFNTKISPLSDEINASGHSLTDIIIMASLVEKEARTNTDKHTVAGILWSRIALHMPLQVDASPDTYTHAGLPSEPICDPGLDSIEAVLHPTKTNYLYYLTGKDGVMHYATTYTAHQANLKKYLR